MKNKNNEISKLITRKIIDNELPEDVLQWTQVEVLRSTVARGVGETTFWITYITIRENGKQVWKGSPMDFQIKKPLEIYGDNIVKIGNLRKSEVFVIKPSNTK